MNLPICHLHQASCWILVLTSVSRGPAVLVYPLQSLTWARRYILQTADVPRGSDRNRILQQARLPDPIIELIAFPNTVSHSPLSWWDHTAYQQHCLSTGSFSHALFFPTRDIFIPGVPISFNYRREFSLHFLIDHTTQALHIHGQLESLSKQ